MKLIIDFYQLMKSITFYYIINFVDLLIIIH